MIIFYFVIGFCFAVSMWAQRPAWVDYDPLPVRALLFFSFIGLWPVFCAIALLDKGND